MKSILFLAVLVSGCAVGMHGAPAAHTPLAAAQQTPAAAPTAALVDMSVEIIASYEHTKSGKLNVSLRAVTVGMEAPLTYHWILGNGNHGVHFRTHAICLFASSSTTCLTPPIAGV